MANLTVRSGDTWPPVVAVLSDASGPVDLTTADSVRFVMKLTTGATVVTGTCVITDAVGGKVSYTWASGDTATVGSYKVEYEVTWDTGKIETFPNEADNAPLIDIDADLD